jgi:hypothetical protein
MHRSQAPCHWAIRPSLFDDEDNVKLSGFYSDNLSRHAYSTAYKFRSKGCIVTHASLDAKTFFFVMLVDTAGGVGKWG